ncbi:MAG TPA: hypothetical protein PLG43_06670 [Spirochaetia bacterium]|jgi:hypothetical protein|nr:hypothetical protein [Spirochaetia bacterium]
MDIWNPFFWAALSGLLSGAALSWVVPPFSLRAGRGKTGSIRGMLYAAVALCAATAGFLLLGAEVFLKVSIIYAFAIGIVLGFLSLCFKRAFGIPLLILMGCIAFFCVCALSSWTPFSETADIVSVRPLSVEGKEFSCEIERKTGDTDFCTLSEDDFTVSVEFLTLPAWYFPLTVRSFYRCTGGWLCGSAPQDGSKGGYAFPVLASLAFRLPGSSFATLTAGPLGPRLLEKWVLRISEDGVLFWEKAE